MDLVYILVGDPANPRLCTSGIWNADHYPVVPYQTSLKAGAAVKLLGLATSVAQLKQA